MPTSITAGQSSTLQWSTANATTITLNGSAVAASGSRTVTPTATTTYTLVATNSSGSVTSTATVTVTAPPALTYVTDIKPILDNNCIMCHNTASPTSGFDASNYPGVMTKVIPYDPTSRLIQVTQPGGIMYGHLSNPTVQSQTIYDWIVKYGAPQQ
jgi:hypothetical protein